jgi:hypothetical protein
VGEYTTVDPERTLVTPHGHYSVLEPHPIADPWLIHEAESGDEEDGQPSRLLQTPSKVGLLQTSSAARFNLLPLRQVNRAGKPAQLLNSSLEFLPEPKVIDRPIRFAGEPTLEFESFPLRFSRLKGACRKLVLGLTQSAPWEARQIRF